MEFSLCLLSARHHIGWSYQRVEVRPTEEGRQHQSVVWAVYAHQADEKEEHKEGSAHHRLAVDVAITDGRHRHDEEVYARPVRQRLRVVELERVTGVFQLQNEQC